MKMKDMYMMMGMFAALSGQLPTMKSVSGGYESREEKEIREVCEWLKITEKELYERCKQKPKMLSKYAKILLEKRYGEKNNHSTRTKGGGR